MWIERTYELLGEYIDKIQNWYGGQATNLDFISDPERSRKLINEWVEIKTRERIKDLIPENYIKPLTRLILTNAVYFKGSWLFEFGSGKTRLEDFRVGPEEIIKVQMMRFENSTVELAYFKDQGFQILELPYGKNKEGTKQDLSMIILLPEEEESLKSLTEVITPQNISRWQEIIKNILPSEVEVYFPKFKFENKYFIGRNLREMGMPVAFSENADFSGMTGDRDLYIDEVIHQTFIEVDEEGTEAAAATAVIMKESSGIDFEPDPIPIFRADRPFIFFIQDNRTNLILFFGKNIDPTKG